MEKICFIINPKAGYQSYSEVIKKIKEKLDSKKYKYEIKLSKNRSDIPKITKKGLKNKVDFFVAVGGDGTVNEICQELIHSNKKIGVIPMGSGNGLAFELGINKDIDKSINIINTGSYKKIDSISINDRFSFNIAGIGYDALISKYFANEKKRGILKYMFLAIFSLKKYKPEEYTILFNQSEFKITPFTIAICNSKQYGNNFHICPEAIIDDGKINVCLIKKKSFFDLIELTWRFYFGNINKSKLYKSYITEELIIKSKKNILMHLDGESIEFKKKIKIQIIPKSINFVC